MEARKWIKNLCSKNKCKREYANRWKWYCRNGRLILYTNKRTRIRAQTPPRPIVENNAEFRNVEETFYKIPTPTTVAMVYLFIVACGIDYFENSCTSLDTDVVGYKIGLHVDPDGCGPPRQGMWVAQLWTINCPAVLFHRRSSSVFGICDSDAGGFQNLELSPSAKDTSSVKFSWRSDQSLTDRQTDRQTDKQTNAG